MMRKFDDSDFPIQKHFHAWKIFFAFVRNQFQTTRTANRLNLSKGYVSEQLKAINQSLGALYEKKTSGKISLTPLGEQAYNSIQSALKALGMIYATEKRKNELHIATTIEILEHWLRPILLAFKKQHPDIHLRAVSLRSMDGIENYDMLIYPKIPAPKKIKQEHLYTFDFHLYASESYLKRFGPIEKLSELRQHAIMVYEQELLHAFGEVDSWIVDGRISEHIDVSSSESMMLDYVLGDLGLAILHQGLEHQYPALRKVLAEDSHVTMDVCLIAEREQFQHEKVMRFRHFIKEFLRRQKK